MWPIWHERIIAKRHPAIIIGEQVANKTSERWIDRAFTDLENENYACAAGDLCSYAVGAEDERRRFFWFAHANLHGSQRILQFDEKEADAKKQFPSPTDPWHGLGHPFEQWRKLLATPGTRRLAHGISSNIFVRPALRGFGNAINPVLASEFIAVVMEILGVRRETA